MMQRFAGSAPVQALRDWRIAGLPAGMSRALGLGTLGAVVAAGSQLLGEGSTASDIGGILGAGLGAYPGAAVGGIAGGLLAGGGRAGRIARPIGGAIGALVGGGMGRDVGSGVARQLAGENEDPMVAQARRIMGVEAERAKLMLPIQTQQAQMAMQVEMDRARQLATIENQLMAQQAAASALMNGQANSAALQGQILQGILG